MRLGKLSKRSSLEVCSTIEYIPLQSGVYGYDSVKQTPTRLNSRTVDTGSLAFRVRDSTQDWDSDLAGKPSTADEQCQTGRSLSSPSEGTTLPGISSRNEGENPRSPISDNEGSMDKGGLISRLRRKRPLANHAKFRPSHAHEEGKLARLQRLFTQKVRRYGGQKTHPQQYFEDVDKSNSPSWNQPFVESSTPDERDDRTEETPWSRRAEEEVLAARYGHKALILSPHKPGYRGIPPTSVYEVPLLTKSLEQRAAERYRTEVLATQERMNELKRFNFGF